MEQDPVHGLVLRALRGSGTAVASQATVRKAIEKPRSSGLLYSTLGRQNRYIRCDDEQLVLEKRSR